MSHFDQSEGKSSFHLSQVYHESTDVKFRIKIIG